MPSICMKLWKLWKVPLRLKVFISSIKSITESSASVINQRKLRRTSICGFIHAIRGTMRKRSRVTAVQCTKTGNEHLTGCYNRDLNSRFHNFFINTSFDGFSASVIKASTCQRAVMTKPRIISNLIHSEATESHLQFSFISLPSLPESNQFNPIQRWTRWLGLWERNNGIELRFECSKHEFFFRLGFFFRSMKLNKKRVRWLFVR